MVWYASATKPEIMSKASPLRSSVSMRCVPPARESTPCYGALAGGRWNAYGTATSRARVLGLHVGCALPNERESFGRGARHRCGQLRDHVVLPHGSRNRSWLGHGSGFHHRHACVELLRLTLGRPPLSVGSFPLPWCSPVAQKQGRVHGDPLTRDQIHRAGDAKGDFFQPPMPSLVHGGSIAALGHAQGSPTSLSTHPAVLRMLPADSLRAEPHELPPLRRAQLLPSALRKAVRLTLRDGLVRLGGDLIAEKRRILRLKRLHETLLLGTIGPKPH